MPGAGTGPRPRDWETLPYTAPTDRFLGAFEKLRKTTICFVMVVLTGQVGSPRMDFHKIWYLRIFFFRNSVQKFKFWFKSYKQNGTLHEDLCTFMTTSLMIFWYFADRASQYIYLNIKQLDALNFIMSIFHASTCFEHMCSSSGGQNCTIQPLVSSHL